MPKRRALTLHLLSVLLLAVVSFSTADLARSNPGLYAPPVLKIYITSNGNIEPLTNSIQRVGEVYRLKENLRNTTITIQCDNIVLDGAGFILSGYGNQWYYGISLSNKANVTIKNFYIKDFGKGISIVDSSLVTVVGNKIYCNVGVALTSSNYSRILANTLQCSDPLHGYGVYNLRSYHNTVKGNSFADFGACVKLQSGGNNVILENQFDGSTAGVYLNKDNSSRVYRNNFLDNKENALILAVDSLQLDNGKEGNYWSDYTGKDGNGDGIGDTRYAANLHFFDNHPFIKPIALSIPNISLKPQSSATPSPTPLLPNENSSNPVLPQENKAQTKPEPFPTTMVVASAGLSAAIVTSVSLVFYFKKRKH